MSSESADFTTSKMTGIRAVRSFGVVGETRPVQESNLRSLLSSVFWTLSSTNSRAVEKLLTLFGFRTIN